MQETVKERVEEMTIRVLAVMAASILWLAGMFLVIKDKVKRYINKKLLNDK